MLPFSIDADWTVSLFRKGSLLRGNGHTRFPRDKFLQVVVQLHASLLRECHEVLFDFRFSVTAAAPLLPQYRIQGVSVTSCSTLFDQL